VKLALVLVNYNGLEDTLECVPTILASGIDPGRIIVVDNGSAVDQTPAIRSKFPSICVVRSDVNLGWSGGNNLGAYEAIGNGADWVFLLNNDTVLKDGWYDRVSMVIKSDQWDVFGPVIHDYKKPEIVQTEGVLFNRRDGKGFFDRLTVTQSESDEPELSACDIVNGCAVLVRAKTFTDLGGIDDRFFLICEESDFCLRALHSGARVGVMHEWLVLHKHSVSFEKAGKPLQRYYSIRNLALLLSRHKTGGARCGFLKTWLRYLRFCHHMTAHEYELKNPLGARAVAEGVADAFLGRFGPKSTPSVFLVWWIQRFFRFTSFLVTWK
jgi:GT2 family glycosyltransferase